jgi:hypothetical protein
MRWLKKEPFAVAVIVSYLVRSRRQSLLCRRYAQAERTLAFVAKQYVLVGYIPFCSLPINSDSIYRFAVRNFKAYSCDKY